MGGPGILPRRRRPIVTPLPARGELWWCERPDVGRRPVMVLSRDAAIPRLRRALIAPCTTNVRGLPSEVSLEPDEDPVPQRSTVNLDSVESVSVAALVERLGRLGDAACVRSAQHSRSPSTFADPRCELRPRGGPSAQPSIVSPTACRRPPGRGVLALALMGAQYSELLTDPHSCCSCKALPPAGDSEVSGWTPTGGR